MKALIVDPGVRSLGGHHYNAVQRLQRELAALGVAAPCLGSAYAERDVIDALACHPTFRRSVYGRSYTAGEFDASVAQTADDLAGGLHRHGMADLLILPCGDQVLAAALAQRLARAWLARPVVLLWLLYAPHHLKAADDPTTTDLRTEYRKAFATLKSRTDDGHRLRIYCETTPLADFYRDLLGLEVGVRPSPGLVAPHRAAHTKTDRAPVVACIGFANRPKGYRLLPHAIAHVLAERPDVRFAIHGIVKGSDAEGDQPVFDHLREFGERVTVRQDVLSADDYLAWLAKADLLLLPYDPEIYRSRGLGVFTDARNLALPIVAPAGCAFAEPAFEEGWGVAMRTYDGRGLSEAMLIALGRLPTLRAEAGRAAARSDDDLGALLRRAADDAGASDAPGVRGFLHRLHRRMAI